VRCLRADSKGEDEEAMKGVGPIEVALVNRNAIQFDGQDTSGRITLEFDATQGIEVLKLLQYTGATFYITASAVS